MLFAFPSNLDNYLFCFSLNINLIPIITDFADLDGNDRMKEMIQENYNRIKTEVRQIVSDELQRIKNAPELAHLLKQK